MHTSYSMMIIYNLYNLGGNYEKINIIYGKVGSNESKAAEKIRESLQAVVPVTAIVLLLCVTITPMPPDTLLLFLTGCQLLILGMGFFTLGADWR